MKGEVVILNEDPSTGTNYGIRVGEQIFPDINREMDRIIPREGEEVPFMTEMDGSITLFTYDSPGLSKRQTMEEARRILAQL